LQNLTNYAIAKVQRADCPLKLSGTEEQHRNLLIKFMIFFFDTFAEVKVGQGPVSNTLSLGGHAFYAYCWLGVMGQVEKHGIDFLLKVPSLTAKQMMEPLLTQVLKSNATLDVWKQRLTNVETQIFQLVCAPSSPSAVDVEFLARTTRWLWHQHRRLAFFTDGCVKELKVPAETKTIKEKLTVQIAKVFAVQLSTDFEAQFKNFVYCHWLCGARQQGYRRTDVTGNAMAELSSVVQKSLSKAEYEHLMALLAVEFKDVATSWNVTACETTKPTDKTHFQALVRDLLDLFSVHYLCQQHTKTDWLAEYFISNKDWTDRCTVLDQPKRTRDFGRPRPPMVFPCLGRWCVQSFQQPVSGTKFEFYTTDSALDAFAIWLALVKRDFSRVVPNPIHL
jgi:hypothetical protein